MTMVPRFSGLDIWVSSPSEIGVPKTYGFDLLDSRSKSVQPSQVRINQNHLGNHSGVRMLTTLMDRGKPERAIELMPLVLEKVLNLKGYESITVDTTPVVREVYRPLTSVMAFLNRHLDKLLRVSQSCPWYVTEDPERPEGRAMVTNINDG